MEEHRRSVEQISETYRILELNLSKWNGILARTEEDIYELRKFARAASLRELLCEEGGGNIKRPALVRRLLYLVWGGCFMSAASGAAIAMVILK